MRSISTAPPILGDLDLHTLADRDALPDLDGAVNDAKTMQALLKEIAHVDAELEGRLSGTLREMTSAAA